MSSLRRTLWSTPVTCSGPSRRLIVPKRQSRAFGNSVASQKALPFTLNNLSATVEQANVSEHGDGLLRMLIFGKPGAGKGTLSGRLVKKYDITSLSAGDLLRQQIAERTETGKLAEGIVATGGLVPDDLVLKIISVKLDQFRNKHWILDGFPRTLAQGEMLDVHLKARSTPLSLIVNLDVPDRVILSRISDRWIHLPSGRVYNMSYNPPKVTGRDDVTGEPLTKRPDDNPEIFARRLKQFYASTSPLLEYYASSNTTKLITLTGETSDEIWPQLESVVKGTFPSLKERVEPKEEKRRHSLADATVASEDRKRSTQDLTKAKLTS
ncbi:adenylate kinase [Neolentinus lepideus HHB14362 ss-1]|uniref:GTP:AMP phosphotransferase, mitochondrial n=1 Tax=Neolentinus lepideus HHB14362 ss-1 TaxID=1314782 RepID=A0A165TE57_9AGAM|nr:adenylate kinase [Neolentinus lepideus HHB14362 ss-1]